MSTARSRIPASLFRMAVFTAVTLLLIGLLGMLIANTSFVPTRRFSAVFTDATGVNPGDHVRLAGVEVGSVSGFSVVDDGERRYAKVDFTVNDTVPVYANAHLTLRYENLVGQRYLALTEAPGNGRPMPDDGTFPVTQTTPALNLTVLFNGFQPLFRALTPDQVNRLSFEIIQTLQGEGDTLGQLLGNTAQLTSTIANKDAVIGQLITNLNAVLGTVDARDTKLTALIDSFRSLMAGLAADRDTIDQSLPTLSSLLTNTTGLVSGVRGPLAADVTALNTLSGQLSATRGTLDQKLNTLPHKLDVLSRTGSYGSWFNFYVCGLQLNVSLLGGTAQLNGPSVAANERDTVCGGGNR